MATLVKVDKNGSKHWRETVTCDRCSGRGWYAVGVHNGELVPTIVDEAVCYKCHGKGTVTRTRIERLPEYQAILDAKREARIAKNKAEAEAARQRYEAEERERWKRLQAEEAARKAVSQYVGTVGEKIETEATLVAAINYEAPKFNGFGTEWRTVYKFRDAGGNLLVWHTKAAREIAEGDAVTLTGTVKKHEEYKGEKQTVLTRCKW